MSNTAKIPQYCHHKGRNLGYVRLPNQEMKYLPGPYGSPESLAAYDRTIAKWIAQGRNAIPTLLPTVLDRTRPAAPPLTFSGGLLVKEFVLAYLKYAQVRYTKHGHFYAIRGAFKPLVKLFRDLPLVEFGPKRFKEVRQALIERGLCRREINRRMQWIRNGIKWAVAEELIPGEVLHRLMAVEILRAGEAPVPESRKVRGVDEALVLQTIKHVSPEVAAMIRVQLLTAARSGEVVLMKGASIDMSKDVWLFRPERHKTQNLGHDRVIPIGKHAQEIIRPFLVGDPHVYLFSPAKAETRRRKKLHDARVTPPGAGNNQGDNQRPHPKLKPGDRYTPESYGRAVTRGIAKAFPLPERLAPKIIVPTGRKKVPREETQKEWLGRLGMEQKLEVRAWRKQYHWHPHQLRHTRATAVRAIFGLDAAQAILGHANLSATQIYADVQQEKAVEVARQVG